MHFEHQVLAAITGSRHTAAHGIFGGGDGAAIARQHPYRGRGSSANIRLWAQPRKKPDPDGGVSPFGGVTSGKIWRSGRLRQARQHAFQVAQLTRQQLANSQCINQLAQPHADKYAAARWQLPYDQVWRSNRQRAYSSSRLDWSCSCTWRISMARSAGRMPTGQMSLQAMQSKQPYICSPDWGSIPGHLAALCVPEPPVRVGRRFRSYIPDRLGRQPGINRSGCS